MKKFTKLALLAGAALMLAPLGIDAQNFKGDGLMGYYYRCKSATLKTWQTEAKEAQIGVDVFDSTMVGALIAPNGPTFDYEFGNAMDSIKSQFVKINDSDYGWFATRFEGFIQSPKTGEYTLFGRGDNGFRVWINDVLVVDHWINDWDVDVTGTPITLQGGVYNKIKVEFAECVGGQNLHLKWQGPGIAKEAIPTKYLFTTRPVLNSLNGTYIQMSKAVRDSLGANRPAGYDNNDAYKYLCNKWNMFEGTRIGTLPTAKNTGDAFHVDFYKLWDIYFPTMSGDNFSARYDGFIKSPGAYDVKFMFWGDNGCRVWIGDTLVVDHWVRDWEKLIEGKTFTMKADTTYKVRIDFFEEGGGEQLELMWDHAGITTPGNDNPRRTLIPVTSFLTHNLDLTSTVSCAYNNITPLLPTTVIAANYNTGGEGEGYSDLTPTNTGNAAFRTTEGVDINLLNNENIVAAAAGEWLKYTVNSNKDNGYKPTINYNSTVASNVTLLVDGVALFTTDLPATGVVVGDSTITLNTKLSMSAGEHQFKILVNAGSINLKSVAFNLINTPYLGVMQTIPGKIESELYDFGGQGVAYWDNDMGHNNGGPRFRGDEGVDIGQTFLDGNTSTPPFKTIGWNDPDEWQLYTVDVKETNDYSVLFHYSSGANKNDAKVTFYLDGNLIIDQLAVPSSNSWDLYRTTKASYKVNLTQGVHILKSLCNTGGFDFEGITFGIPVELIVAPDAAITTHGGKVTLSATVTPVTASNKALKWKIDGNALGATIDKMTGVLTASGKGNGNGTIKVVALAADEFGVTDTLNVVITNQMTRVATVTIDPAVITVDGGNVTPALTVLPDAANDKTATWTIEGESLGATIEAATGKVTASSLDSGNGIIIVKATANDGSGISDTTTVTISGQVGILNSAELLSAEGISVYPNPMVKVLNISGVAAGTVVEIFNAAGILVKSVNLTDGTINVSDLSNGIYIVKFNGLATRVVKK